MKPESIPSSSVDTGLSAAARDFSVKDRVVIITGAGQGIGRELARQFAAAGAIAVIADLSLQNATSVAAEITGAGGKALALAVDVSKKDSVDAMVAATLKEFGRLVVRDVLTAVGAGVNGFGTPYRIEFTGSIPAPKGLPK